MTTTVTLTLAFPLIGLLYCAVLGWRVGRQYSGIVATAAIGASFASALLVLAGVLGVPEKERFIDIVIAPWINAGRFQASLGFIVDPLSTLMLCVVTGVGFLIHVYATAYMRDHHGHLDPGYNRFFAFMNLFILAMLVLVLADNFVLLMVGWGGVGVCSYFLIAFWFEKPENASAGTKAFVVNAIGDVGLFLAAFLIYWTYGRVDYDGVFKAVAAGQGSDAVPVIALLLLVAAAAKSAQLPLHVWLPDAMAGPTPVSALIHAATMVTAGVYIIARAHPIYEHAPAVMALVAALGTITALFAATIAITQSNLKRVVAYSTISQLGYMFAGVGVGAFGASMFHLTTHAFFKAVLFLAAGIVIHELSGEEEMKSMGGLRKRLPLVYWCFVIAAAANAGFPLLSGFFSKDEIIGAAFSSPTGNPLLGMILVATSGLTGFYMFRAVVLTFHGQPSADQAKLTDPASHGPSFTMVWPVVLLTLLAIVAGLPYAQFGEFLHPALTRWGGHPFESSDPLSPIALGTAAISILGIGFALAMYSGDRAIPRQLGRTFSGAQALVKNGYYIDAFYGAVLVAPGRVLALVLSGPIDNWIIDGTVSFITAFVRWMGIELGRIQTGFVRNYALAILAGVVIILGFMMGGRS
ncbi:MAG: NADH-quinone oxidoreductase subunit L [Chloroflexota bacterium]|nr:MAG: NADH-quinone oxidoreductase subunit L [Chloroflexota bacterium]